MSLGMSVKLNEVHRLSLRLARPCNSEPLQLEGSRTSPDHHLPSVLVTTAMHPESYQSLELDLDGILQEGGLQWPPPPFVSLDSQRLTLQYLCGPATHSHPMRQADKETSNGPSQGGARKWVMPVPLPHLKATVSHTDELREKTRSSYETSRVSLVLTCITICQQSRPVAPMPVKTSDCTYFLIK